MGDQNVHSYEKVDEKTTGGDYSNDVVARAQWYDEHLFPSSEEWSCVVLCTVLTPGPFHMLLYYSTSGNLPPAPLANLPPSLVLKE